MDLDLEELKMGLYVYDDVKSPGYRILSHVTGELAFKVIPKLKNIEIDIMNDGTPASAGNGKPNNYYKCSKNNCK